MSRTTENIQCSFTNTIIFVGDIICISEIEVSKYLTSKNRLVDVTKIVKVNDLLGKYSILY